MPRAAMSPRAPPTRRLNRPWNGHAGLVGTAAWSSTADRGWSGALRVEKVGGSEHRPAAELMQPGPTTVRAHEDLDATRRRMSEHHVAHLLVTTPDGVLLGIVDAAQDDDES